MRGSLPKRYWGKYVQERVYVLSQHRIQQGLQLRRGNGVALHRGLGQPHQRLIMALLRTRICRHRGQAPSGAFLFPLTGFRVPHP